MKIIDENKFTTQHKGKDVALYTLENANGVCVQITNFGAKIVSIFTPDKKGEFADIVQGYDNIDDYINGMPYFGAICGRYANRIAKGKFSLDGKDYELPINNGVNSLHGGPEGFNNQVFDVPNGVESHDGVESIVMEYFSKDGEQGYPGNLEFTITYSLTEDNELVLDYHATCDQKTHVNICSHSFFNLAGCHSNEITSHKLRINSNEFTPYDDGNIPTGEIRSVEGSPMDFREEKVIGKEIDADDEQIKFGVGYDHNWIINKPINELGLAAIYSEPISGRTMEVYTTQPGIQVYTSNWLDKSDVGKGGVAYGKRSSICLETQGFPDSPNKPDFPSTLLKPGEEYSHKCIYKFV